MEDKEKYEELENWTGLSYLSLLMSSMWMVLKQISSVSVNCVMRG